ncbi:glycosyltransferase [Pontibacter sp. JH31]|uniref:Glycosyltransferase n=1 Tax=Pontibacter aquaedesilientis TaxID=2766980 RepID=A0ABR7XFA6_9BACT|nr:glycosyltransferase [Pontibacter aquaedesilientis]MBD1396993.1 glycosyltransferase [Pontibacter aquaedesilientis]
MNIVLLGLSITSSWGNGHATTYRSLVKALQNRGHQVLFLEREAVKQAGRQDLPQPDYCQVAHYTSVSELGKRFEEQVREAEMVIVGSGLQDGKAIGEWVFKTAGGIKAFYDLDAPTTIAGLEQGNLPYLNAKMVPRFDLYLSCSGGPTLQLLEQKYGSPMARPLYFSFDPELYFHEYREIKWDLGYLGTYSEDRMPGLTKLMLDAADQWPNGRFAVAGARYPSDMGWTSNVTMLQHLSPAEHRDFFNSQRFTLSIARAEMSRIGYTPSMRLFEAAACCVPIISDHWEGIETLFEPETEILISAGAKDTLRYLREICNTERKTIGSRARRKVLSLHTADHRAQELEGFVAELMTLDTRGEKQLAL